jgi:hypothetical protein
VGKGLPPIMALLSPALFVEKRSEFQEMQRSASFSLMWRGQKIKFNCDSTPE